MSTLPKIEMFVEVVKRGSFAAAATHFGVSGPAISKQISALEEELGVKLLYRTTRKQSLTEEGSILFDKARKAMEDLTEVQQELQELKECPTGKLKINAPMSFGQEYLTKALADFAKTYPEVELEIDFSDRWVDIVGESYDLVLRIGVLQDSTHLVRKLNDCPIYLCAAPSFLDQIEEPATPEDLANLPAVTYSQHGRFEDWNYQNKDTKELGKVRLSSRLAANTAEMQLQACLAGIGIAVLPGFTVSEEIANGRLVRLLEDYETAPERGIYVLYPHNRQASSRVRLIIEALYQHVSAFDWSI